MKTARVTSKGQITIPKEVREKLGLSPGEDVGFVEQGGVVHIAKVIARSPFDRWVGKLNHLEGKTSDEILEDLRKQ